MKQDRRRFLKSVTAVSAAGAVPAGLLRCHGCQNRP